MEVVGPLLTNSKDWECVSSFLWDPFMWVAPEIRQQVLDKWELSEAGSYYFVRQWCCEELGILPYYHIFSYEDGSRFLVLDAQVLLGVVHWLGACAYLNTLRTVTDSDVMEALRVMLPGIYPEILHHEIWLRPLSERLQNLVMMTQKMPECEILESTGWSILYALLAHLPSPLLRRFQLRFSDKDEVIWKWFLPWMHQASDLVVLQRILEKVIKECD